MSLVETLSARTKVRISFFIASLKHLVLTDEHSRSCPMGG